ncbi:putative receptor-like protein 8 [Triticum aestivum]|uniref:putative receptor-like protein 8 n=1 Tax=Triticum aestivum TaxID=4565 RepID=UPI001D021BE6|nr:putative receptor-like protein 8 [Triticum aestivum]
MTLVNLSTIVHWLPVVNMLPTLKVLRLMSCQLKTCSNSLQLSNLTSIETLDLSENDFHGPFPDEICNMTTIVELDLSFNNLVGMIPSNMKNLCNLETLSFSGNNMNGSITELFHRLPNCSQNKLQGLSSRYNNLSGSLPTTLVEPLRNLSWIDLGHNKLTGQLPVWIGELTELRILALNSNNLDGVIHEGHLSLELTKFVNLQYLDLAYNNISGSIPRSISNCTGMAQTRGNSDNLRYAFNYISGVNDNVLVVYSENFTVLTKGQERLYTGEFIYMVNLDLSCNSLTGAIPADISTLVALKSLNLSWNNFNGKIPANIGALMQVESLDLSHNELSGEIPSSLSALTSLSRLNLSYNNLRGKIPTGNQLQTLEDQASIYIGNPGLCGPPLSLNCSQSKPIPGENHGDACDGNVVSSFIATGSGYVMGLWVVFCTFLFKRRWRVSWYSLCDSLYDRVYVQVAVTWASLRGKKEAKTGAVSPQQITEVQVSIPTSQTQIHSLVAGTGEEGRGSGKEALGWLGVVGEFFHRIAASPLDGVSVRPRHRPPDCQAYTEH